MGVTCRRHARRTLVAALAVSSMCLVAPASALAGDPSLSVTSSGPAATFVQGRAGELVSFAVVNAGADTSAGDVVSVRVVAPPGLTLTSLTEHDSPLSPTTWQCAAQVDGSGICTTAQTLSGASAPAIDARFTVGPSATSGSVLVALSTSVTTDAVVASTPLAYTIAAPYTLVFSSPMVSGPTTAPAILGPITLAVRDAVGNPRTVDAATTVSLTSTSAGATFAASAGGAPVTTLTIAAHTSGVSFFYGDTLPGLPRLIASAPALFAAGQVESVVLGPAAQIAFTTAPTAGEASGAATLGPIAVQVRDAYDNPVALADGAAVALSTSSAHGWFAAKRGGAHVTAVNVAPGSASASFWYGDTAGGTPVLTATVDGLQSARQGASLTGGPGVAATGTRSAPTLALTVTPRSTLRYRSRLRTVRLTAHLSGSAGVPTGTVTFASGRRTVCARRPLRAGVATCRVHVVSSIGTGGRHVLSATYAGSAVYTAWATTVHYRVVKLPALSRRTRSGKPSRR